MIGENIYEYVVDVRNSVEYGASLADILSGDVSPPIHTARFDVYFEGQIEGRIFGKISGADFAFKRRIENALPPFDKSTYSEDPQPAYLEEVAGSRSSC